MKNRIFAILNWKKERSENVQKEIIEKLPLRSDTDKIIVFCRESDNSFPKSDRYEIVLVSENDGHNSASALNFVYKYLKDNFNNSYGYVMYDSMQFKKDPSKFMDAIEEMMQKLHLDIWFNTYTDPMNFVFSKFDGRVSVAINDAEFKQKYDKTIIWTSHANPNLSIIDLDGYKLPEDGKTFDDRFEISMFWIIKFLCERRRDKKGFMNYYPTIAEEVGVYKVADIGDGIHPTQELMKKEDEMFTALKLDHTPSQNVEELMDFIIDKLKAV